jgi:hypothetical protein
MTPPFLSSVLHVGECSASRSGRFTPGTHWIRGWTFGRKFHRLKQLHTVVLKITEILFTYFKNTASRV